MQQYSDISVQNINMFTKAAYLPKLAAELQRLRKKGPDLRILFENELVLNRQFAHDNYFTYLLGKHRGGNSAVNVAMNCCLVGGYLKSPP